jgi:mRNA deadenylase 3'-5' endonuclease subunit Ccr4
MSDSKSVKFTLFQWNTLNRKLADKEYFPYTEDKYLQWYHRHPLIKKIIEENKSDIICLEEVGNFDLDFQKKIFDQCSIKYNLLFEFRTGKLMGNVLAVNKDLFSIEKHEVIVLKGEQEGKSSGQSAVIALIKEKKGGNNFLVIVVHLKSKEENEKTRLGQINHLMEYIEKYHLGNYPIFILGDFNAEPTYSCILKLLENKKINAKSLFDFNELGFSTIKLRDKLYKRIIDYIFFVPKEKDGKDKELKILTAEKAKPTIDEKIGLPNDVFPSDHLFLKAKVELNFV